MPFGYGCIFKYCCAYEKHEAKYERPKLESVSLLTRPGLAAKAKVRVL